MRLEVQSAIQRSPVEQQYNRQLEEAKQEVLQYDRELKEKIRILTAQNASDEYLAMITLLVKQGGPRARARCQWLMVKQERRTWRRVGRGRSLGILTKESVSENLAIPHY